MCAYLIFVANISNEMCGEKFVMWRNFRFLCVKNVEKSEIYSHVENFKFRHMKDMEKSKISPHMECV